MPLISSQASAMLEDFSATSYVRDKTVSINREIGVSPILSVDEVYAISKNYANFGGYETENKSTFPVAN